MVTDSRYTHPSKALSRISVTELGMVTDVTSSLACLRFGSMGSFSERLRFKSMACL